MWLTQQLREKGIRDPLDRRPLPGSDLAGPHVSGVNRKFGTKWLAAFTTRDWSGDIVISRATHVISLLVVFSCPRDVHFSESA